jgi:phospholipid transport system substrate-binding protein
MIPKSLQSETRLNRRTFLGWVYGGAAGTLALVWTPASSRAGVADDGAVFLISLTDRAISELADESVPVAERKESFRRLFKETFDIPAIGRFVLGRYWRAADKDAREEFLMVFEDVMVDRFAPQFAGYAGTKFKIGAIREVNDSNQIMVSSTVAPPNSEVVQVDWRLRHRDGRFMVLDVVAQGVSMALTLRSEYSSVLKSSGGRITDLIALLRERTNKAG